jgi:hypothetical protein
MARRAPMGAGMDTDVDVGMGMDVDVNVDGGHGRRRAVAQSGVDSRWSMGGLWLARLHG